MKITILTLFPEMFDGPFRESILKHAQQKNLVDIHLVNIRDFGQGRHKVVDDRPYGGGVGMVMKVDVLDEAIKQAREKGLAKEEEKVALLDARGMQYNQKVAKDMSHLKHLILLCGHYEGVDERVRNLVDITISIGDFILTGGEIPAMLLVDSIVRLIPGVLKEEATNKESFSNDLLEYPQYTTPREYTGMTVPDVLLSGNHKEIKKWQEEKAQEMTQKHRPDLIKE